MKFYLLHLIDGVELAKEGPFDSNEARLKKACADWNDGGPPTDGSYNVFWADVDADGNLTVGEFTNGDLEGDDNDCSSAEG